MKPTFYGGTLKNPGVTPKSDQRGREKKINFKPPESIESFQSRYRSFRNILAKIRNDESEERDGEHRLNQTQIIEANDASSMFQNDSQIHQFERSTGLMNFSSHIRNISAPLSQEADERLVDIDVENMNSSAQNNNNQNQSSSSDPNIEVQSSIIEIGQLYQEDSSVVHVRFQNSINSNTSTNNDGYLQVPQQRRNLSNSSQILYGDVGGAGQSRMNQQMNLSFDTAVNISVVADEIGETSLVEKLIIRYEVAQQNQPSQNWPQYTIEKQLDCIPDFKARILLSELILRDHFGQSHTEHKVQTLKILFNGSYQELDEERQVRDLPDQISIRVSFSMSAQYLSLKGKYKKLEQKFDDLERKLQALQQKQTMTCQTAHNSQIIATKGAGKIEQLQKDVLALQSKQDEFFKQIKFVESHIEEMNSQQEEIQRQVSFSNQFGFSVDQLDLPQLKTIKNMSSNFEKNNSAIVQKSTVSHFDRFINIPTYDNEDDASNMSPPHSTEFNPLRMSRPFRNVQKNIDMAYLYADPLIRKRDDGRLVPVDQPLDLEIEFSQVVDNLRAAQKQFTIMREAINLQSLNQVIQKNPKIIHISAHGAYEKESKHFYLAIEDAINSGLEDQFSEDRLANLLGVNSKEKGSPHQIKLAFISACHSEAIGEIFFKAGIPVVISVNSDQPIMDKVCKLFSEKFYRNLLEGKTIKESFEQARRIVQVSKEDFETCCCAHKHEPFCSWFKFSQTDTLKAHEIHSKPCKCYQYGVNGRRQHNKNCQSYIEFVEFLSELKKEENKIQKECSHVEIEQKSKCGGLGDLDLNESDDEYFIGDDFEDIMINHAAGHDQNDNLVMCCCMKNEPHDETMKFTFKFQSEDLINTVIFENRNLGELYQLDEEIDNRIKIPLFIDRKMLYGRNIDINEILQFLTNNQYDEQRILNIYGTHGNGRSNITRYAIKYVMRRHYFEGGAFFVECQNKFQSKSLMQAISKKLMLSTMVQEEILEMIKKLKILLLLDNCDQILEKDFENFVDLLFAFIQETEYIKVIVITKDNKDFNNQKISRFLKKKEIKKLDRKDSVKMLYQMNEQTSSFIKSYPNVNDLAKHPMFEKFTEYSPLSIIQMSLLMQNGIELDQIFQSKLKREESKDQSINQNKLDEQRNNEIINFIFQKLKDRYLNEMNVLLLLSNSPAGLIEYDIDRICYNNTSTIDYGDWRKLLNHLILKQEQNINKQETSLSNPEYVPLKKQLSFISPMLKKNQSGSGSARSMKMIQNLSNESKIESSFSSVSFELGYAPQIVRHEYMEDLNQVRFFIDTSFLNSVRQFDFDKSAQIKIKVKYLKYMAILSRQLLSSIKRWQVLEINPYIVSSQLDKGFWDEPKILRSQLIFKEDEFQKYSQYQLIENAITLFQMHDQNFQDILDQTKLKEIYGRKIEQKDDEIAVYLDEICTNVPSILIMLNKYQEAEQVLEKVQILCQQNQLEIIEARCKLIKNSLMLELRSDIIEDVQDEIVEAERIFSKHDLTEGVAETQFLQAILHIKNIENFQKNRYSQTLRAMNDNNMIKPSFNSDIRHSDISLQSKIQKEYQCALEQLKISRSGFKGKKCARLKTYFVEAELQLLKIKSPIELPSSSYLEMLFQNLEESANYFLSKNYDVLYTKCLFLQANIKFKQEEFVPSRDLAIQCLSITKEKQLGKLQFEIQKFFRQVSYKIEIEINNWFIFAKAQPITSENKRKIIFKNIIDDHGELKKQLDKTRKSLNIKFDVLTKQFLLNIVDKGCKVLHLAPHMFQIENNQQYMVIENECLNAIKLTPKQLKDLLKPVQGSLNIYLVIIELTNCKEFAKVFNELGVAHVISFSLVMKRVSLQLFHDEKIDLEMKMNLIQRFMKQFTLDLYPLFFDQKTIKDAVEIAEERALKSSQIRNYINIKVDHLMSEERFKDKLYDNERIDPLKKINKGYVCDISKITILNYTPSIYSYVNRFKNDYFSKLVGQLSQRLNGSNQSSTFEYQQLREINIYGQKGVGKSRLVEEVANYMSQRSFFDKGIYKFDLHNVRDFSQITDMIRFTDHANFNENQEDKKKKRKLKRAGSIEELKNEMLIIFDNCDKFVNENKTSFQINLKFLKKKDKFLSIILISEQKLDDEFFNFETMHIQHMMTEESILMLHSINPKNYEFLKVHNQRSLNSKISDLIQLANGNAQILYLLNLIYKFGGINLLIKTHIEPKNKLKEVEQQLESQELNDLTGLFKNQISLKNRGLKGSFLAQDIEKIPRPRLSPNASQSKSIQFPDENDMDRKKSKTHALPSNLRGLTKNKTLNELIDKALNDKVRDVDDFERSSYQKDFDEEQNQDFQVEDVDESNEQSLNDSPYDSQMGTTLMKLNTQKLNFLQKSLKLEQIEEDNGQNVDESSNGDSSCSLEKDEEFLFTSNHATNFQGFYLCCNDKQNQQLKIVINNDKIKIVKKQRDNQRRLSYFRNTNKFSKVSQIGASFKESAQLEDIDEQDLIKDANEIKQFVIFTPLVNNPDILSVFNNESSEICDEDQPFSLNYQKTLLKTGKNTLTIKATEIQSNDGSPYNDSVQEEIDEASDDRDDLD